MASARQVRLIQSLPGRGGACGASRFNRKDTERFKSFTCDELTRRDKVNLDIFWLKDEVPEESANLPAPEIIATEIAADLEAALEQFATVAEDLNHGVRPVEQPAGAKTPPAGRD